MLPAKNVEGFPRLPEQSLGWFQPVLRFSQSRYPVYPEYLAHGARHELKTLPLPTRGHQT